MTPYHNKFLVRSREMWYIAKEDPHGIVHEVQPVGSYFWDMPQIAAYHKKLCVCNTLQPLNHTKHNAHRDKAECCEYCPAHPLLWEGVKHCYTDSDK